VLIRDIRGGRNADSPGYQSRRVSQKSGPDLPQVGHPAAGAGSARAGIRRFRTGVERDTRSLARAVEGPVLIDLASARGSLLGSGGEISSDPDGEWPSLIGSRPIPAPSRLLLRSPSTSLTSNPIWSRVSPASPAPLLWPSSRA